MDQGKEIPGSSPDTVLAELDQAATPAEFVEKRRKALEMTGSKQEVNIYTPHVTDYIHPEAAVKAVMMFDGVNLDDPALYAQLADSISEFKNTPGWAELPARQIILPAIQRAIGQYFGNYEATESGESARKQLYMDNTTATSANFSITEMREKGMAACSEKAAVAHNFLRIAGFDASLINLNTCKITDGEGKEEAHAFNVVRSDKGPFIFDPTNPILVQDGDNKTVSYLPALYRLKPEEYTSFMNGGQVTVQHSNQSVATGSYVPLPPTPRIYGGPKSG